MSQSERNELEFDLEILLQILHFHGQNEQIWVGRKAEYEEHINAVLDRINEIRQQLNEQTEQ